MKLVQSILLSLWCGNEKFFSGMKNLFIKKKRNRGLTQEEFSKLFRDAIITVQVASDARLAAASVYSDVDFFDAIMALPCNAFYHVASKIGPIHPGERDRGIAWYIHEDYAQIRKSADVLTKMGLLYWDAPDERGGGYMNFDERFIDRLAANAEGVARLRQRLDILRK